MQECWQACGVGERLDEERVQWSVDWQLFSVLLQTEHPVFDCEIPPYEFAMVMRVIAAWKNAADATPGGGLLARRVGSIEEDDD